MVQGQEISFDDRKKKVNEIAKETLEQVMRLPCDFKTSLFFIALLQAFSDLLHQFASTQPSYDKQRLQQLLSKVGVSIGHRWSAAFPSLTEDASSILDQQSYVVNGKSRAYVDSSTHFAACGDYLVGKHIQGRLEGAILSGIAAADSIINLNNNL